MPGPTNPRPQSNPSPNPNPILIPRASLLPLGPLPPVLQAELTSLFLRTGTIKQLRRTLDEQCTTKGRNNHSGERSGTGSAEWEQAVLKRVHDLCESQSQSQHGGSDGEIDVAHLTETITADVLAGLRDGPASSTTATATGQENDPIRFPRAAQQAALDLVTAALTRAGDEGVVRVRGEVTDGWVV